ncbi:MAG: peptidase S8 [Anaerolineae bacterium]|nr:peptidase S8 [Anaerolineae bacterium]
MRYAEPNALAQIAVVPTDPDYSDISKVYAPQMINAETAWNYTTGSASVTVAVLDTGISFTHPEFSGQTVAGYDFVHNDSDPSDDEGHGTHVSGIVAAAMNNGQGNTGIAPGVKIMPLKVMDYTGYGSWVWVADGVIYATDHGADVINMSLGSAGTSYLMTDAVAYAASHDVVMVAASGNSGLNQTYYPAGYPAVIAVGGTDYYDVWWTLSNYGTFVDVTAPGDTVWSTNWTASNPNAYQYFSGTSQAAPHVSGLAALILSAHPSFSAADVRAIIQQTAVDKGAAGYDIYYGFGRIDAGASWPRPRSWAPLHRDAHRHANAALHQHADLHADDHADADSDQHPHRDADADAAGHRHAHRHTDAHANPHANRNRHTSAVCAAGQCGQHDRLHRWAGPGVGR